MSDDTTLTEEQQRNAARERARRPLPERIAYYEGRIETADAQVRRLAEELKKARKAKRLMKYLLKQTRRRP